MKQTLLSVTILIATILLLVACGDDTEKENNDKKTENQTEENQDNAEENDSPDKIEDQSASESDTDTDKTDSDNNSSDESPSNDNDSNNQSVSDKDNTLSGYSSKEIEYARVWLQLGENQDIDKVYAEQIPAGEPLNPNDDTSVDYPEDVVQLSGTRLVDGVVTYSSNGDGTVNVYDVPKRWDGKNPAGEDTYKKIIDSTKQESIDPGEDEKVEELIKILNIN